MSWRFSKSCSILGGISILHYFNLDLPLRKAHCSWTTNYIPSVEWDFNWDSRADSSAKLQKKAVRHIILIRHGQYQLTGATDKERILTELGRHQAKLTGQRLADLNFSINEVVISTMARAQETGNIILDHLPKSKSIVIRHDSLIEEGAPIPPEPRSGHYRPEFSVDMPIIDKILN